MADTHHAGVAGGIVATAKIPPTAAGRATGATSQDVPSLAAAGTVLEALARRDFGRLAAAMHDDVHLRALLPGAFREWYGRAGVQGAFSGWFDDFKEFELVDAAVDGVGPRLHLGWRLRVRAARPGSRWLVIEQQVYADADADGQIFALSVLCSGFCPERTSG
jgi:ketosteroid isomerase-like protein